MSTSWRIICLDHLQVSDGTQIVTEFPSVPAKLLVASLALRPGELVPRDILCERLWPEAELERQRARFRWTLSQLRKALSPELFVSSGNSAVGLAPGTTSDVAEFDAHIRASFRPNLEKETLRELLHRAEELHKVAFLPGVAGEWVESERERRIQQLDELRQRAASELVRPPDDSAGSSDRFFGRASEQLLLTSFAHSDQRLLTVTGTGGLGKTRLVREALLSKALLFVPMAALTDAGGLFDLLRELLKLPASGYGPVQERVIEHLKTRGKTLLLLDNAEQIAEGLAPLVETLLAQCPDLQLVVTSRRRLKMEGEQVLKLEPLPQRTAEDLFLARAQATNPRFATTKGGQAQVGAICKLLEGIPLALEIAAARALLVSPAQMHQELATRLRFLVRLRGAEARQLSVRAALEWSYELLSPQARLAFRRSGVFRSGFTLAAARFVFGDTPPALDAIQELIEHSLLKPDYQEDGETEDVRYTQLEVVRELAELLLKTIPTDYEDTSSYHADFYLIHARKIGESVQSGVWEEVYSYIANDLSNIGKVIEYAFEKKKKNIVKDIIENISIACIEMGYWGILMSMLDKFDLISENNSAEKAYVSTMKGVMSKRYGDMVFSKDCWVKSLHIHTCNGNIVGKIFAYIELASQAVDESDDILCFLMISKIKTEMLLGKHRNTQEISLCVLESRYYLLVNNIKESIQCAQKAMILMEKYHVDDRFYCAVMCHLLPSLTKVYSDREIFKEITKCLKKALESRQKFNLGLILLESGKIFLDRGDHEMAVRSLICSDYIHNELDSRFKFDSGALLSYALGNYRGDKRLVTHLEKYDQLIQETYQFTNELQMKYWVQ